MSQKSNANCPYPHPQIQGGIQSEWSTPSSHPHFPQVLTYQGGDDPGFSMIPIPSLSCIMCKRYFLHRTCHLHFSTPLLLLLLHTQLPYAPRPSIPLTLLPGLSWSWGHESLYLPSHSFPLPQPTLNHLNRSIGKRKDSVSIQISLGLWDSVDHLKLGQSLLQFPSVHQGNPLL